MGRIELNEQLWVDLRRTSYRTLVILVTLGGAYLLYLLRDLVVVLFLSLIFASTVRPIIGWLQRKKAPRSVAIALVYGAAAAGFVLLFVVAVPPLIQLVMDFAQEDRLAGEVNVALVRTSLMLRRQFEVYVPIFSLPPQMQEMLDSADETVAEQALPFAQSTFATVGRILLAIVLSIYWLVARGTALRQILMLTPKLYRNAVYRIWVDTEDTLGAYLRSQVILGLIIGAVSYAGLLVLQVPNARALAVIAGLLEFVPFVGPSLAAIPAVLVGLTVSPVTAILVLLFYVIVQAVEGNYLVPKIMGRGLRLHPMIVLLAITAGFYLAGVVGAILALPLAGAVQITVQHLRAMSAANGTQTAEAAPEKTASSNQSS